MHSSKLPYGIKGESNRYLWGVLSEKSHKEIVRSAINILNLDVDSEHVLFICKNS